MEGLRDRMLGSFLGGITGDAYGSYAEFKKRDTYEISPNMETTVFGLPPGSFTDDSSMMLCLAASLVETGTFSPIDQMKRYAKWRSEGYMSSCEERGCFDIGRTTSQAIFDFVQAAHSRDGLRKEYYGLDGTHDAGNGGIMRLAPVPIVLYKDVELAGRYSALSSKVTHASPECLEAASVMGQMIARLLQGQNKREATLWKPRLECSRVMDICEGSFLEKGRDNIRTTGYVIDSLEAALWSFHTTETFEKGMILLGGCGGDVDTVCCIYGQIAGAYYGYSAIPKRWVDTLQRRPLLDDMATRLVSLAIQSQESPMPLAGWTSR
ncbi:hypothetical protein HKX48_006903 [Thoreauomyces humboldtii]|nr:hypothetical protein HKX48_006903 [Thoreauomyces humboldtii]